MLTDDDKKWLLTNFAPKEEFEKLAKWMDATFATKEQLKQVETRLLTEFNKWSSPLEMRMRTHATAMRALDMEIEAVQDRVKKLEGRDSA